MACARTEILDAFTICSRFGLRQPFVIRDFNHEIGYVGSEGVNQFFVRHPGVFNRVVKQGGDNKIRVGFRQGTRNQFGNFEKMIYVM
jgi:hypothetical protein